MRAFRLSLEGVCSPSVYSLASLVIYLSCTCALNSTERLLGAHRQDEAGELSLAAGIERPQEGVLLSKEEEFRSTPLTPQWFINHHSEKTVRQFSTRSAEHRLRILLHTGFGRTEFGSHRIFWVKVTIACAYCILVVIGLVSNLIVIYIILCVRRKALASITNIFVLVLAVSDTILCGFNIPFQIYYELKETASLTNMSCKIIFSLFTLPTHVSCLTILLIACDRYHIIIHPMLPRMSTRMAACLVAIIVTVGIFNSIPLAVYSTISYATDSNHSEKQSELFERAKSVGINHRSEETHVYCVEDWPSSDARLVYSIVVFFAHFAIPLVITAILYGRIYCRLHERQVHRKAVERKRRTNKILFRIVVCFAILWSPWTCFSLWLEVHAYDIQKQSLAWVGSHYVTAGESSNAQIHENNSMVPVDLYSGSKQYLDEADNLALLQDHPVVLKMREMDVTIRLVDLLLKLVAMSSSCINPWLYGWLNKFFGYLYRKYREKSWKMVNFEAHLSSSTARREDNLIGDRTQPQHQVRKQQDNSRNMYKLCEQRTVPRSRCSSQCCGVSMIFHLIKTPRQIPRPVKQDNEPENIQAENIADLRLSGKVSRRPLGKQVVPRKGNRGSSSSPRHPTSSRACGIGGCGLCASLTGRRGALTIGKPSIGNACLHDESINSCGYPIGKIPLPGSNYSSISIVSSTQSTRMTSIMPSSSYLATPKDSRLPPLDQVSYDGEDVNATDNALASNFNSFANQNRVLIPVNCRADTKLPWISGLDEKQGIDDATFEPVIVEVGSGQTQVLDKDERHKISDLAQISSLVVTLEPNVFSQTKVEKEFMHLRMEERCESNIPFIDDFSPVLQVFNEEHRIHHDGEYKKSTNPFHICTTNLLNLNVSENDASNNDNKRHQKQNEKGNQPVRSEINPDGSPCSPQSPNHSLSFDSLSMDETDFIRHTSTKYEWLSSRRSQQHQSSNWKAAYHRILRGIGLNSNQNDM